MIEQKQISQVMSAMGSARSYRKAIASRKNGRKGGKPKGRKTMYYIAINQYRSSTDNGFGNTWEIYTCDSRKRQIELLTKGLPVSDQCLIDNEGRRSASYSSMGIRLATKTEIRRALHDDRVYGYRIPSIDSRDE